MVQSLDYAHATLPAPTRLPRAVRVLLRVVYYTGWVVGCAFTVTALLQMSASYTDLGQDRAFWTGVALGGVFGPYLAFRARRTRWPQVVLLVVGSLTAAGFGLWTIQLYIGPRGFLWGLAVAITAFFAGVGVCVLAGGVAGLLLAGRPP